jgi:hypothetical protein
MTAAVPEVPEEREFELAVLKNGFFRSRSQNCSVRALRAPLRIFNDENTRFFAVVDHAEGGKNGTKGGEL